MRKLLQPTRWNAERAFRLCFAAARRGVSNGVAAPPSAAIDFRETATNEAEIRAFFRDEETKSAASSSNKACDRDRGGGGDSKCTKSEQPRAPPSTTVEDPFRGVAPFRAHERDIPSSTGSYVPPESDYLSKAAPDHSVEERFWKQVSVSEKTYMGVVGEAPPEIDFVKLEEDMREEDHFHWRVGQTMIDDEQDRRDYYVLHAVALTLNKTRWKAIEAANERGGHVVGSRIKTMYYKEAFEKIIKAGRMPLGEFTDGNPTLRTFADVLRRRPFTRSFLHNFVEARLQLLLQPGNMEQVLALFDRMYGDFLSTQLELFSALTPSSRQLLQHVGRASGVIQHCALLWKKYAAKNMSMLPANVCADNQVNLQLLRNLTLASRDKCVRRTLYDVLCYAQTEMDEARKLVEGFPMKAWPLLSEALLPNYYLHFLMKHSFDVSARSAEDHVFSPGFYWFCFKKMHMWRKHQDLRELLAVDAPLPYLSLRYWTGR